jgi:hypothetical protein
MTVESKPPQKKLLLARALYPFVDEDGDIHIQLLDDEMNPFAEFVYGSVVGAAVTARIVNC